MLFKFDTPVCRHRMEKNICDIFLAMYVKQLERYNLPKIIKKVYFCYDVTYSNDRNFFSSVRTDSKTVTDMLMAFFSHHVHMPAPWVKSGVTLI